MQINEAIEIARQEAEFFRRCANKTDKKTYAVSFSRKAKAIENVCDKLETFLRRQEEDNSYHTK